MERTVETKRKKKGRPSLLDLQKRSLRLQKQQQEEAQESEQRNPSPNPYAKFPNSAAAQRRATRTSTIPNGPSGGEGEEKDEDEGDGNRREKKLNLVLRTPPGGDSGGRGREEAGTSGSDSDTERRGGRNKRRIDAVCGSGDGSDRDKTERHNLSKSTNPSPGEREDSELTTPLPDKKLLLFILDRLQKKDTYGVFSAPVDPDELPDYHDIVEHPMDFSTIRKKLSIGAYANLENFEKDVFLISSNAMCYNASDTIYFRQARSIQELAIKDFENLRQESDDNEPEPKIVRRVRPPCKNSVKKPVGRPPAYHVSSNVSADAAHVTAVDNTMLSYSSKDLLRKVTASDKPNILDSSARTFQVSQNAENYSWLAHQKSDRNEDSSGSMFKGCLTKYGKKVVVFDENHRKIYKQPPLVASSYEPSVLTTFYGERKELIPVGLHIEHSYARSLARFAANLGHVGWVIAARKIERALPPATAFGCGWIGIGEEDTPQPHRPPLLSTLTTDPQPSVSSFPSVSGFDVVHERTELSSTTALGQKHPNKMLSDPGSSSSSSSNIAVGERHSNKMHPASSFTLMALDERNTNKMHPTFSSKKDPDERHSNKMHPAYSSAPSASNRISHPVDVIEASKVSNFETSCKLIVEGNAIQSKPPFQSHQTTSVQPTVNGFSTGSGFGLSQDVLVGRPPRSNGNVISEALIIHAIAHDAVSKSRNSFVRSAEAINSEAERAKSNNLPMLHTGFSRPAAPPSHVEASDRMDVGSFNSMNLASSCVHHMTGQQEKLALSNSKNMNPRSRFVQPISASQLEAETKKMGNSSAVNSEAGFTHPLVTSHVEVDKIKAGNPGAMNFGNNFARSLAVTRMGSERIKSGNQDAVNSGSTTARTEAASHLEVDRTMSVTSNTMNSRSSFSHSKEKSHLEVVKGDPGNLNPIIPCSNTSRSSQGSHGFWQGLSVHRKPDPPAPDLNVRFQSPGSPASGLVVDSQQPDLALQL